MSQIERVEIYKGGLIMDNMRKVQSVSEENMNEVRIFEMCRIQVKAVQSEKIKVSVSESSASVLKYLLAIQLKKYCKVYSWTLRMRSYINKIFLLGE